jgi:hypothetical protein
VALRLFLTAFGTGVFLVLFLLITATTLFQSEPGSTLSTVPMTSGPATATPTAAPDIAVSPSPQVTQEVQSQSPVASPEPIPTETAAPPPEPSPTPVSETQPVAPAGASPPSGLGVTYSAGQGVVLGWTPVAGAAYYNVYRSQVPGGGPGATYTAIGSSGAPSFVDGTALSGQSYYYVVTASANGIESDSSNEASILVP